MNVLLFYFAELGGLGGVEVAVVQLAEAFTRLGHPSGIAEIAGNWKPRRLLPGGIPVWGVTAPSFTTIRRPRSWASFIRTTAEFVRVVRQFSPDIIHVHYPLSQALPVIGAHALPHHWRLVVTVHNSDIRVSPFQEPRIRPWQDRLFRRADAVTAVSGALLADASNLYPCISGKGHVVYNGVGSLWFDRPSAQLPPTQRYVFFGGRMHTVKGVDILLHSWTQVISRFPDVQLWLAGDGPELQAFQDLTKNLGLLSSVRFIGRKRQEELPVFYRNAEAVILPSRREGLPFSLLEAGAAGGICIGTKIPGIPEIIRDGTTGLLVEPESPAALADAIIRVLGWPAEQQAAVRTAAARFVRDEFSEERMISGYIDVFDSVAARRPAGSRDPARTGKSVGDRA